ncbi:MAG TPA: serine hydrolase [Methanospirillum sp.]|nr:serine hydrolase [Methanospirillum sp.]
MQSPLHYTQNNNGRKAFLPVKMVILIISISLIMPTGVLAKLNDSEKDRIIQDFDGFAGKVFNESGVPGMSIAITDRNKTLYSKAFGVCSLDSSDPVTLETTFMIGSITKAFTATILGSMVDEGRISWNDTVLSVLPCFALKDSNATTNMTIGELLTHNSGLWPYDGDLLVFEGVEPSEVISRIGYLEMQRPFRSGFGYNNLHYFVASEVINISTGEPWSENLRTRIFTPLGMDNTSTGFSFLNKDDDKGCNYASHHALTPNGYTPMVMDEDHIFTDNYPGAGGIRSNINDMAKWLRFWLNAGEIDGRLILKPETVQDIIRPANIEYEDSYGNSSYAHGWVVKGDLGLSHSIIWHNGGNQGIHAYNGFIPEEGIGIVILTNAGDTGVPEILGDGFLFQYCQKPTENFNYLNFTAMREFVKPQYPESLYPQPEDNFSIDLDNLSGTYQNSYYGEMKIYEESGDLYAELGQRPVRMRLTPVNETSYLFSLLPLNIGVPNPDGMFSFDVDPGGQASKITVLGLTMPEEPPYSFTRI